MQDKTLESLCIGDGMLCKNHGCSCLTCDEGACGCGSFALAVFLASVFEDGEGDSVACVGASYQSLALASTLHSTFVGGRPALHRGARYSSWLNSKVQNCQKEEGDACSGQEFRSSNLVAGLFRFLTKCWFAGAVGVAGYCRSEVVTKHGTWYVMVMVDKRVARAWISVDAQQLYSMAWYSMHGTKGARTRADKADLVVID